MAVTQHEISRYRDYNRTRLEDWLGSWASTSKGRPDDELTMGINRKEKPGPQGPGGISMARLESLLSEDIKITDRLLQGVVDELRRERFLSYENLIPLYFDQYASEGTLEYWRTRAKGEPRFALRVQMADAALEWMLLEAERNLIHLNRKRLVVLTPWASIRTATDLVLREQRLALDLYYRKLEEAEEETKRLGLPPRKALGLAMERAVQETGYSERWIRKLRSDLGGETAVRVS